MHVLEKAFIDLLRDNLCVPNANIYAGNRYRPSDMTPCVNLLVSDESLVRRRIVEKNCKQYIQQEYNAELWINIWCNSEEERQTLINQIRNRIYQALANHYTTCSHYNDGNCNVNNDECEALTSQKSRANKNQCPDLDKYLSFFYSNHIPKRTFRLLSVTDLDELELSETLLRTIFKLEMNYYDYYEIGGRSFQDFKFIER